MKTAIQVERIVFGYRPNQPVLQDVSFAIRNGTFLAVAGPNGAGKSTLISLLSGLLKPHSGRVLLDGVPLASGSLRDVARKIAVVRQEFVPAFGFSVMETVLMARTLYFGPLGFEHETDRQLVRRALEMTDTLSLAARPLADLSAGERQRVFIARALAQDTPILLLDEPTSFLDFRHQVGIYDLLKSIQRDRSRTIVAVTHDLNLATQYCDEALLLYPPAREPNEFKSRPAGPRWSIGETSQILTPEAVEKAFGVGVFSGMVGRERFLMPLGAMAKDAGQSGRNDRP